MVGSSVNVHWVQDPFPGISGAKPIISARSDAVLVVEAKENSGSLITADLHWNRERWSMRFRGRQMNSAEAVISRSTTAGLHTVRKLCWKNLELMEKVTQNGEKNNLGLARDFNMV